MRELFQRDLRYLRGEASSETICAEATAATEWLEQGHRLFDEGRFAEALRAYGEGERVLAPVGEAGDRRGVLLAALAASSADCHANLGDFDQAIAATEAALGHLRSGGHAWHRCRRQLLVSDRRAFYLAWIGRCDAAILESDTVVTALRKLVAEDPAYQPDLARSLDHRAEMLERAYRLPEAHAAAVESTSLRRALAEQDATQRIPFLRSAVTLARITGAVGNAHEAVSLCRESDRVVAAMEGAIPEDLKAQLAACHGRNLVDLGEGSAAEAKLLVGLKWFRALTLASHGASIHRDAYAEVMLDLGRMHIERNPTRARAWLIRAAAHKRFIARQEDHPLHWASLAEALIAVQRTIDKKVALLLALETVNGMAKTAPMTDEAMNSLKKKGSEQ